MRPALLALALAVAALAFALPAKAQVLRYADLGGWAGDDHREALAVFVQTCDLITGTDWQPLCAMARKMQPDGARSFFELFFRPVVIGTPPALFTGYFEPEFTGSPVQTPRFAYPLYSLSLDSQAEAQGYFPAENENPGISLGRTPQIAWLENPAGARMVRMQGSGLIRMPDGRIIRIAYAGQNSQTYASGGATPIRRNSQNEGGVTEKGTAEPGQQSPAEGRVVSAQDPAMLLFRRVTNLTPDQGPIGAMARPITPMRTIAVDPSFVPLGAPVWVEKAGQTPLRKLMIAQDTGGAIKGAQRADIFFGTGAAAGAKAGQIRDTGRMIALVPIEVAYKILLDG